MNRTVIVSNGLGRSHIANSAPELQFTGSLRCLVTGAYVARKPWHTRMRGLPRVFRLLDRAVEIRTEFVKACWAAEIAYQLSQWVAFTSAPRMMKDVLASFSLLVYRFEQQLRVGRTVRKGEPGILLMRTGFGGRLVEQANAHGWITVADHSIAYPRYLLEHGLVQNRRFWKLVEQDIHACEYMIANSEFVAETVEAAGYPRSRIRIVPMDVEEQFCLVGLEQRHASSIARLLFVGTCEARKGIDVLAEALGGLAGDWTCTVVGGWDAEMLSVRARMAEDPRVTILSAVARLEVAALMRTHDIFIFPTRAEGSARVVMEALASGMAVVTTPEAGSAVIHSETGLLVPAGTATELRDAVASLVEDADLRLALGGSAAHAVSNSYPPGSYGHRLAAALTATEDAHDS